MGLALPSRSVEGEGFAFLEQECMSLKSSPKFPTAAAVSTRLQFHVLIASGCFSLSAWLRGGDFGNLVNYAVLRL